MRSRGTTKRSGRRVTINLRADQVRRALIDRAAERLGKNRSEFMLEAACREATSVLLDQRLFLLMKRPTSGSPPLWTSHRQRTVDCGGC